MSETPETMWMVTRIYDARGTWDRADVPRSTRYPSEEAAVEAAKMAVQLEAEDDADLPSTVYFAVAPVPAESVYTVRIRRALVSVDVEPGERDTEA